LEKELCTVKNSIAWVSFRKTVRSIDDDPGELISYSEWKDQQSIDAYSVSEAREELKNMRGICIDGRSPVRTL
jgi:hypothetical protein